MNLSEQQQRLKEMEHDLHIRDVSWNGFLLTPEGKALRKAVNDQRRLVRQLEEAQCTPTPTSNVPATSSDSSSSVRA